MRQLFTYWTREQGTANHQAAEHQQCERTWFGNLSNGTGIAIARTDRAARIVDIAANGAVSRNRTFGNVQRSATRHKVAADRHRAGTRLGERVTVQIQQIGKY